MEKYHGRQEADQGDEQKGEEGQQNVERMLPQPPYHVSIHTMPRSSLAEIKVNFSEHFPGNKGYIFFGLGGNIFVSEKRRQRRGQEHGSCGHHDVEVGKAHPTGRGLELLEQVAEKGMLWRGGEKVSCKSFGTRRIEEDFERGRTTECNVANQEIKGSGAADVGVLVKASKLVQK